MQCTVIHAFSSFKEPHRRVLLKAYQAATLTSGCLQAELVAHVQALSLETEGKKDTLIERILSNRAQPQEQIAEVFHSSSSYVCRAPALNISLQACVCS